MFRLADYDDFCDFAVGDVVDYDGCDVSFDDDGLCSLSDWDGYCILFGRDGVVVRMGCDGLGWFD